MLKLIKNGHLFSPKDKGIQDILIVFDKILFIGNFNDFPPLPTEIDIIDAEGHYILPGFIDLHVHITGGGGETGPTSRTPEIKLSHLTQAGITTAIGLLGFDGTTRSVPELLAKARALDAEGISTFIFSGAYEIPTRTITGSLRSDLVLIDKVIGCGELAISDHRSAQPTMEMLAKLGAEARVGGMLGNKAGIVHLHVGEGKQGLQLLFDVLEHTDIPKTQFLPTHVNRLKKLFEQSLEYAKQGGYLDLTAGFDPKKDGPSVLSVPEAIQLLLKTEIDLKQITVSSDGNGSLPIFDSKGNVVSLEVGSVKVLWNDIRTIIKQKILPLDKAISLITINPSERLSIKGKGKITIGADADLVIIDKDLNIETVMAKGRIMVRKGEVLVKGAFEN